MTGEYLLQIAAGLFSLAARWAPRFNAWYEALDSERKRGVMVALIAGAAVGMLLYDSGGVPGIQDGTIWARALAAFPEYLAAFVFALASNQGVYRLIARPVQAA